MTSLMFIDVPNLTPKEKQKVRFLVILERLIGNNLMLRLIKHGLFITMLTAGIVLLFHIEGFTLQIGKLSLIPVHTNGKKEQPSTQKLTKIINYYTTGALHIKTNPAGVRVYLNREYVAETPSFLIGTVIDAIMPGTHELRLEKEGFIPYTRNILIEPLKVTNISVTLLKDPTKKQTVTLMNNTASTETNLKETQNNNLLLSTQWFYFKSDEKILTTAILDAELKVFMFDPYSITPELKVFNIPLVVKEAFKTKDELLLLRARFSSNRLYTTYLLYVYKEKPWIIKIPVSEKIRLDQIDIQIDQDTLFLTQNADNPTIRFYKLILEEENKEYKLYRTRYLFSYRLRPNEMFDLTDHGVFLLRKKSTKGENYELVKIEEDKNIKKYFILDLKDSVRKFHVLGFSIFNTPNRFFITYNENLHEYVADLIDTDTDYAINLYNYKDFDLPIRELNTQDFEGLTINNKITKDTLPPIFADHRIIYRSEESLNGVTTITYNKIVLDPLIQLGKRTICNVSDYNIRILGKRASYVFFYSPKLNTVYSCEIDSKQLIPYITIEDNIIHPWLVGRYLTWLKFDKEKGSVLIEYVSVVVK